jgi:senataxin
MVYGLSEEEAADWQERYRKRSNELLTTCDRCVRNWHIGRKRFLKEISG